ncbi:MAG TPA: NAD(P)-dependent oxidoreductase [Bacteriovoracaceae bacterium]|nr:NAD(P)-dependent oxidoreductase [Bacteriovoracaceae bacterium]
MQILVTGATGFIGQHLVPFLQQQGFAVHRLVRKRTDLSGHNDHIYDGSLESLEKCLRTPFDGIIHLAAYYVNRHTGKDISDLINSNILFPTQLLETAGQGKVRWIINTGSYFEHFGDTEYSPINLYAGLKKAFQDIGLFYTQNTPIKFLTLKITDSYGPNDNRPKILNIWKNHLNKTAPLEMSGGEQYIDLIHTFDICRAFLIMINLIENKSSKFDYYAIDSTRSMRLKDLAKLVSQITSRSLNIAWGKLPYSGREFMRPWKNIRPLPDWSPTISLEEGLMDFFK